MSNPRNRKNPSQPSRAIQKAQPDSGSPLVLSLSKDRPAPSAGETDQIDLTGLSFRQQAALPAIAAAPSLAQAARDAGIEDRTLRRWLRDPRFAERLAALRQQSVVLAREELGSLARRGMSVFAEAMEDPDPAIRLRAARYALSHAVQLAEIQNLGATLQEMRQFITQSETAENARK